MNNNRRKGLLLVLENNTRTFSPSLDLMLTGLEWLTTLSGGCLLASIIICIVIFLAFVRKIQEDLALRILNILFVKLAISNVFIAIFKFTEMVWAQSGMVLSDGLRIFTQIHLFCTLSKMVLFLEISLCSLLRLHNSELYMRVSLNTPHRVYTIIQAFTIVLIQFLIFESRTRNPQNAEEFGENMKETALSVVAILVLLILILQTFVILR